MTTRKLTAALAAMAVLPLSAALAEDYAGNYEHCLSLQRIRSTEVVDDRHIVFKMIGGGMYVNQLPHACPGLSFEDAFMYRPTLSQLCDLDTITVLQNRGFGFTPGISCGLGMFEPVTAEKVAALKEQNKVARRK